MLHQMLLHRNRRLLAVSGFIRPQSQGNAQQL